MIKQLQGNVLDAENFDEAIAAAYRAWTKTSVSSIPRSNKRFLQL
jgi:hypothetical protein